MNILYIGKAEEIGAKIVNHLARADAVAAVFSDTPVYETDCETVARSEDLAAVIRSRKIDAVLCLEAESVSTDEIERLFSAVAANPGCRLYYVKEQSFFRRRKTGSDAAAWLCERFAAEYGVQTVFLSVSCLYSEETLPAYPQQLLQAVDRRRELCPAGGANEVCDCLHIDDFCAAAEAVLHGDHPDGYTRLELQSAYPFPLSQFIDVLARRYSGVSVQPYEESREERAYTAYPFGGSAPQHRFTEELPSLLDGAENRRRGLQKQRRKAAVNTALKLAAFAAVFLLVELYTWFISVPSDLQYVDLRLLFIVAASLLMGKRYGVAAAALCSAASITQGLLAGHRWYVLFYHVDNWIPIAVYFIAAILLGLYQDRRKTGDGV